MYRIHTILFIFNCVLINIFSQQNNLKFSHISLKDGLSQNTVNAIVQDKYGFMWFGTQDGLNRYDGYSIKIFRNNPEDNNSLSDNRTTCMLSDANGDLWIGTVQGGVDRYILSQNKFIHYPDINSEKSSNRSIIISLFEDSNRSIWIGTDNGLYQYNSSTDSFRYFHLSRDDNINSDNNIINSICEDKEKNLWVGTSKGLYTLDLNDEKEIKKFNQLDADSQNKYDEFITTVFIDRKNNLWIGTDNRELKRYDKRKNIFIKYDNSSKIIKTILQDKNENLWIGTSYSELFVFKTKDNNSFEINSNIIFTKDIRVNALFEDDAGIIWIGTFSKGVYAYDWLNNQFNGYLVGDLNPNDVKAILQDKDNELWVGTLGNGLKRFSKERKKITTYEYDAQNPNSINSNGIRALCETKDGDIWIATTEGLARFDKLTGKFKRYKKSGLGDLSGLSNNDLTTLYESKNGDLWIGNIAGGLDHFDRKRNIFIHYYEEKKSPKILGTKSITSISEDEDGNLWIASLGNGLVKFYPDKKLFQRVLLKKKNNDVEDKVSTAVLCIYQDSKGIIWAGIYGGQGLVRFDPETNLYKYFSENDGLSNNNIFGILPDDNGNLWLSTFNGISKFNLENHTFKNYYESDGLQSNQFNQGAHFRNKDGELFFGGINGFNSFFPDDIKENTKVPPIYLTKFKNFNTELPIPDPLPSNETIEIPYSQNFFSFEFVALNYTVSEKNKYAYKLEGFDKDWYYVTGKQRFGSYTNIDPGDYTLRIKGSNNDGYWNETGASVNIIITPPFWMTWWFKGIGVLLLLSIGPAIYYRRVYILKKEKTNQQEISKRIIEKQEEERSRIALEMHDVLGQDLLLIKNRLLLTISKNENDLKTFERLNNISEDISKVLKSIRNISHNLRPPDLDQLGLTEAIQSILLSMRESTSLKVSGNVDNIDGLLPDEKEINLVRIVQEASGNIIKHSEATECKFMITKVSDKILIEINDNGKGFDLNYNGNKPAKGLGLIGMTERVRILNGTFEINSGQKTGTKINISIPLENVNKNNKT